MDKIKLLKIGFIVLTLGGIMMGYVLQSRYVGDTCAIIGIIGYAVVRIRSNKGENNPKENKS